MSSGGGDDYSARAAEIEARKQLARDRLNVSFGVSPTGRAPTRELFTFTRPIQGAMDENGQPVYREEQVFDQAAFDDAVASYNAGQGEASRNKTARDALYDTVRSNAFTAGTRRLDEDRGRAQRDLKFALFAQGLNGGSVDVDENATLGRTYSQGLLDLGGRADAARAGLANSDEQTRLGLLQSIDAGMDSGSALSSAINQMQVNSQRAAADAQGTAVGDLFADAGLLYTKTNAARGRQQGLYDFNQMYGNRSPGAGQGRNAGGIVTSTG